MATRINSDIRVVHLTVRLAATPTFELRADERVNSVRSEAAYSRSAAGAEAVDLLREVLGKLQAAYGNTRSISLTIDEHDVIQPT